MVRIIVEASKYLLLALMVFFTIEAFMVLRRGNEEARNRIMRKQILLMTVFNILAYLVMFLQQLEVIILMIMICVLGYILVINALYRLLYPKASLILVNIMCMMLSVGFVIQTRLGTEYAWKQMLIVVGSTVLSLFVPIIIRKIHFLSKLTWLYAVLGILLLAGVWLLSRVSGGANLSLSIGGISFQFSEVVKLTFVFFVACMLKQKTDFRQILIVSIVAAIHVGILVLSTDLGAAVVFFLTWVVLIYAASRKLRYVAAGFGLMALASVAAYHLFNHIRIRVSVWLDPFSDYANTGYQIVQAMFAISAGGWFGKGLFQGSPDMIPLAMEDFTFAAICEEMGVLFAICLLLLCMAMYFLILRIAMVLEKPFYKLLALGLGTEYCVQVFLTVGGTTKFIPMTGITLPLISYGGSSIVCTILMLAIIQGLYILRTDEDREERMAEEKAEYASAGRGSGNAGRARGRENSSRSQNRRAYDHGSEEDDPQLQEQGNTYAYDLRQIQGYDPGGWQEDFAGRPRSYENAVFGQQGENYPNPGRNPQNTIPQGDMSEAYFIPGREAQPGDMGPDQKRFDPQTGQPLFHGSPMQGRNGQEHMPHVNTQKIFENGGTIGEESDFERKLREETEKSLNW